jgi:hypothetical protein
MTTYPTRKLEHREHYAVDMGSFCIRQDRGDRTVTLQVRRVKTCGTDENLQIDIETFIKGEKRNTTQHTSMCLSPEFADALARACVAIIEPTQGMEACEAARAAVKFAA